MFARKVIRQFGSIQFPQIHREFNSVRKLCIPKAHQNIVVVFETGRLPDSWYWYIDMEICDFNLQTYILRQWTAELEALVPSFVAVDKSPISVKIHQIVVVMKNLFRGVIFIHSLGMVHRDLKPSNSISHGIRF